MKNKILEAAAKQQKTAAAPDSVSALKGLVPEDLGLKLIAEISASGKVARAAAKDNTVANKIFAPQLLDLETKKQVSNNELTLINKRQELTLANAKRKAASEVGTVQAMDALTSELTGLSSAASVEREEYLKLRNTSIGKDGFMSWLSAQFTMTSSKAEMDEANQALATTSDTIRALGVANSATQKARDSLAITLTEGEIVKIEEGMAATLESTRVQKELDGSAAIAKGAKEIFDLNRSEVASLVTIANSRRSSAQLKLSEKADARATMTSMLESSNYKELTRLVNIYKTDANEPNLDEQTVKAAFTSGGDAAVKVGTWVSLGLSNRDPDNLNAAMGNSLAESFSLDVNRGHTSVNANTNVNTSYSRFASQARKDFEEVNGLGSFSKASPDQYNQAVNQAAKSIVAEDRKEIKAGGGNIFSMLPMEQLNSAKSLQENRLWVEVIQPANLTGVNEQALYETVGASLVSGKFKIEEASEDFYAIMSHSRLASIQLNNFERRHISNPKNYPIELDATNLPFIGNFIQGNQVNQTYDLYDKNSIKAALVAYLTVNKAEALRAKQANIWNPNKNN